MPSRPGEALALLGETDATRVNLEQAPALLTRLAGSARGCGIVQGAGRATLVGWRVAIKRH